MINQKKMLSVMVCLHVDNWTAIIYLYFQIHTKICRNLISRFFFVLNMFIEFSLLIACKKINLNSNQNTCTIVLFALHLRSQWNTFPTLFMIHFPCYLCLFSANWIWWNAWKTLDHPCKQCVLCSSKFFGLAYAHAPYITGLLEVDCTSASTA